MEKAKVSAPGKIILSGEHSVVYGQPAIVTALDKRLFVEIKEGKGKTEIITDEDPDLAYYALLKTEEFLKEKLPALKIKIGSEILVNRGLGSSAALSVAVVAALFNYLKKELDKDLLHRLPGASRRPSEVRVGQPRTKLSCEKALINQIAFEIEKKQHGQPSGCDNSIATFGGTIEFRKGKIKPLRIKPNFDFLLIDSGRAVENTGEMVALVRRKFNYLKTKKVIKKIGKVTVQLIKEFKRRDFNKLKLKTLIAENEKLLEELGVVGEKAQKITREIEDIGGTAKICGAGGIKSGSGIILGFHQNQGKLKSLLRKQNIAFFKAKIHQKGVRIEKD